MKLLEFKIMRKLRALLGEHLLTSEYWQLTTQTTREVKRSWYNISPWGNKNCQTIVLHLLSVTRRKAKGSFRQLESNSPRCNTGTIRGKFTYGGKWSHKSWSCLITCAACSLTCKGQCVKDWLVYRVLPLGSAGNPWEVVYSVVFRSLGHACSQNGSWKLLALSLLPGLW